MTDPVSLVVPADARFKGLAPDVGGRYVVAAGGSEADAAVVGEAIQAAIDSLTAGSADADVALDFRVPSGSNGSPEAIEVTVRCDGQSSVVTHPLPAAKT
jgi:hypothetical protein